jgi:mRNA interferase RelE/StbE
VPYNVEFTASAAKDIKRLDHQVQERAYEVIARLAHNPRPHGILQLEKDTYRIRFGDYRLIYEIQNQRLVVLILRVQKARRSL